MGHDKNCPICKEKEDMADREYKNSPHGRLDTLELVVLGIINRLDRIEKGEKNEKT